jgi:hypothetical protein
VRTPRNIRELKAQLTLIRERIRAHKSSLPASIIEAIYQLEKRAKSTMILAELMHDRIASLLKADQAASRHKQRKKKIINSFC